MDYHHEPFAFSKVFSLFGNIKVVLFLLGCITFGACIGITWQFLFWYLFCLISIIHFSLLQFFFVRYLEDLAALQGCGSLQWIKLLQGLVMGIQCFAGEAPFLFLSGIPIFFNYIKINHLKKYLLYYLGWFLNKLGHVHTMTMILVRILCNLALI